MDGSIVSSDTVFLDIVHILLLEDNAIDVELLSTTLSSSELNCRFTVVDTQAAFCSALNTQAVDIVLADYSLPAFDGLSAIKLVKASALDIPCILVSGVVGEERAIEALKSGATDYVLKQRLERLVPAVKRALREQQERKALIQTTAELQASETRFQTSVETMADCLMLLSAVRDSENVIRDFTVSYLNAAACEYLSVSQDRQVGIPIYSVIPAFKDTAKETSGRIISFDLFLAFCGVVETSYPFSSEVICSADKQSSNQFVVVDVRAAKLDDGLVLTWRDVTKKKQDEQRYLRLLSEADEARNQAEQANQFKDVFLANLSHELRSPLSAIMGWLDISIDRLDHKQLVEKAIRTSYRNAELLDHLLEDLLSISQIPQNGFYCDLVPLTLEALSAILNDTVDAVSPSAKNKGVKVTFLPDLLPSQSLDQSSDCLLGQRPDQIMGDSTRLQQVFRNLLSNAVKFTPAQGQIAIALRQTADSVNVSIQDTGEGIPPEKLPYIFKRFWQGDQNSTSYNSACRGLGLGLPIVKYIVDAHSGQIVVESDGAGKGSRFVINLPLVSELATSSDPSIASSGKSQADALVFDPSGSEMISSKASNSEALSSDALVGCRVLIVEDHPDGLYVYKFMLEAYGATVEGTLSATDALDVFQEFKPHILISDIKLPDKSGYELIREIRSLPASAGGDIPAVALTALSEASCRTRAILAGFQRHIAKPIELQEMATVVSQLHRLSKG
ncbi:MAG: response regulator [Phormidesmis sp.]